MARRTLLATLAVGAIVGGQLLVACGSDDDTNLGSGGKAGSAGKGSGGKGGGSGGKGGSVGSGGAGVGGTDGAGGSGGADGSGGTSTGGTGGASTGGTGGGTGGTGGGTGGTGGGTGGTGGGTGGTGGGTGGTGGGTGGTGGGTGGTGGGTGGTGGGTGGTGGGTGGTGGGTGGTGGGTVCGNSIVEAPEQCDPATSEQCGTNCQEHTSDACLTCEQGTECVDTLDWCDTITGNAIGGPATGTSRKALCFEVLQCARTTDCGVVDPQKCYCGTALTAECVAGQGNGVCKTQIERAHESTSASFILANYLDINRGGGAAMARITCDQVNCNPACF